MKRARQIADISYLRRMRGRQVDGFPSILAEGKVPQNFNIFIPQDQTNAVGSLSTPLDPDYTILFKGGHYLSANLTGSGSTSMASIIGFDGTDIEVARYATGTMTIAANVLGCAVEFVPELFSNPVSEVLSLTIASGSSSNGIVFDDYVGVVDPYLVLNFLGAISTSDLSNAGDNLGALSWYDDGFDTYFDFQRGSFSGVAADLTAYFQVLRFNPDYIQSIQNVNVDYSGTLITHANTLSPAVNMNNTVVFHNGCFGATNTWSLCDMYAQLTSTTNLNLVRNSSSAISYGARVVVVEFKPGVLNTVQRGTISLTTPTPADATITEVDLTKSSAQKCGQNRSSNGIGSTTAAVFLNDSTHVRGMKFANAANGVPAYEVHQWR